MKKFVRVLALAIVSAIAIQLAGCAAGLMVKSDASPAPAGAKVIVTVGHDGFNPNVITVNIGQTLIMEFTRITDDTCATKVVFPELGITKDLVLNNTVEISIPTDRARTLTYQCSMGMFKSSIVVK